MSSFTKCNLSLSYRLELPGILLMYLSVPFLIIPSVPTITGTVVVFWCDIVFPFLGLCVYSLYFWQIWYNLSSLTYPLEGIFSLFHSLTTIFVLLLFILLSLWIAKTQTNVAPFTSHWLLVWKPSFTFQYSVLFTYFTMNVMSSFIMFFFLIYQCYDWETHSK